MSFSHKSVAALAVALVGFSSTAYAGFDSSSSGNVAIYWGQNSYGGSSSQDSLATYCANTDIDIIPMAFLTSMSTPAINFASATSSCTTFSDGLLDCPDIGDDITTCQSTYGKTILLSIGGATYTEGGFSSADAASTAADTVWAMFGPVQSGSSVNRPFGTAVVDGFDFDFESSTSNMATFGSTLRASMDAATAAGDKTYYLSAAPQCPYPDVADNDMLDGAVSFDFIMIQFYNNNCGLTSFVSGSTTQATFNYATWDTWATTVSKNSNVKILIGVPGSSTAAGSGYVDSTTLASIIEYAQGYSTFGGIMIWDVSQVYQNSGFLDSVASSLDSTTSTGSTGSSGDAGTGSTGSTTTSITTAVPTTLVTSTIPAATSSSSSSGVAQWGQCGGTDYAGSTTCASGYTCVELSSWWSQCE